MKAKDIVGISMIIAGIGVGLYVGLWLCFIGGIISVIEQIRSPEAINVLTITWGIARIFLAGLFGVLSAIVGIIPGLTLVGFFD